MRKLEGPDLFTYTPPPKAFDGSTYDPKRDHARLKGQLGKVYELMLDGAWRTLAEIRNVAGGTEASVSARLRDLRKTKYGSHIIKREHVGNGLFRYRMQTTERSNGNQVP